MSAMRSVDVDENAGLFYEVFEYLVQAIVYTPVYFLGVATIALPFTILMLAIPQNELAGYVLLVYISWSIIFGQLMALNDFEGDEGLSGVAEFLAVIATGIYYNLATLLTVSFAIVFGQSFGSEAGVVVALLLPALDVQASRLYQFGLAYVILEGAQRLGRWIEKKYEQIPIREMVLELLTILSSVGNAVPPVVHYLSLNEFTRHRPFR